MNDTTVAPPSAPRVLEACGLGRSYHGKPVVIDVDLAVPAGQTVAVLGPSGAGKSTMLRCLAGLEPIQSGSVAFQGDTLAKPGTKPRSFAGRIGMVFQQFNLFPHLTALENITLAPRRVRGTGREKAEADAFALLERVGLPEHRNHYPYELSGGQQQRVAIARALAMRPELMLFDEPTSALDPEFTREVLAVMRNLAEEGMTIVTVTHEMEFARRTADRVVFMVDGRIVEDGNAEAVFTRPTNERTKQFLQQILGE
ncbi:amino acid ABC transporter ATP-binding protein [Saccharopolyspora spinosa]|uniref:Polar amino acid transport system ATP-binding protein/general L-amino acid transport system ATP-binding protein n=2 Tax=Saccharopolyspora spinosa TaxID=60894 RepID=A0A2N3Y657_SACSN|nr:amino acid ABC transporter ATP-binding protein [Saccharopolyspora spinosa]PKW18404.1 polar amino acid transport system ATP-binding protein/general L-amino acid transport system ATP-binding protein [Saccharopolyspora spinosa]